MRQLSVVAPRRLEWRDVPAPVLAGPDAAIVRPIAVAVCDFDRAVVAGLVTALPFPIAIGHEIVAEVVEVGQQVKSVSVGTRVVVPLQVSCGSCDCCRAGRSNSCQSMPPLSNYGLGTGTGDWGGGMSDLLSVPFADAMLVPVPESLSSVDCAAVGCNFVDVYRTIAPHLQKFPNPDVLVVSGHGGTISLYAVAMARALGARQIDFLDDDPQRLTEAEKLGARPVKVGEPLAKQDYPIVIDGSLIPERLAAAVSAVGCDGVCTTMWPYPGPLTPIPLNDMFKKGATLTTGQPHARALIEPVLDLMKRTSLRSTSIPVEVLPWDVADTMFGFGSVKRIFVR